MNNPFLLQCTNKAERLSSSDRRRSKYQVDWWLKQQPRRTTGSLILRGGGAFSSILWRLLFANFSSVMTTLKCPRYWCF